MNETGNNFGKFGVLTRMRSSSSADQMLQGILAAAASLFLILTACVAGLKPPAHGVRLLLPREPKSFECGDARTEVIHWGDDGSVWLNEENVGASRAPARVAEVMADRAERVIFLIPGKNSSVQDVAELAARLNSSVDDLQIGLVTNRQVKSMTRTDNGITWVPIECMGWP